MAFDYDQYIRGGKLPHIWCPGCTYGIVFKSLLRAVDTLKIPKNDIAMVSGIGCASRLPGYVDFNTLHTTHGRALPFATGIKMANPEKHVLVVSGDGDATAIGGNHFIHACRRNIDITVMVFNNFIYGMTGGQYSPTTPSGHIATTMPYGNIDRRHLGGTGNRIPRRCARQADRRRHRAQGAVGAGDHQRLPDHARAQEQVPESDGHALVDEGFGASRNGLREAAP
jgi:hypothetical protein